MKILEIKFYIRLNYYKSIKKVNIKTLKNIYFLGIGGIGMSAIARWFIANGYTLAGYDKTRSEERRVGKEC